jgi:hypothetical protein
MERRLCGDVAAVLRRRGGDWAAMHHPARWFVRILQHAVFALHSYNDLQQAWSRVTAFDNPDVANRHDGCAL